MRFQKTFFTLVIGVLVASYAVAQTSDLRPLTKAEIKEWKKKKKKMTVEDFRTLTEENRSQRVVIASQQSEIENLAQQAASKDTQVGDLQKQISRMQAVYTAAEREIEKLKSKPATTYTPKEVNGEDFNVGVVFKVQVGAFRKMDLKKYAESSEDFKEESMDELRKYIIGNFRVYDDANVLKRYLREMGVEDAWIVPYRDGKRVALKSVLDSQNPSN